MSLLGFKAKNHPQQVGERGRDDSVDDRCTTAEVYDPLHALFDFTIDVAASDENAKCERYYSIEDNGLEQSWAGERVWCNPPYSDIAPWVAKAWAEFDALVVVMLLPANRTEQTWWQRMVEPYRDQDQTPLTVEFLPGRLRFLRAGKAVIGANERPPFGCCLLTWHNRTRGSLRYQPSQAELDFTEAAS